MPAAPRPQQAELAVRGTWRRSGVAWPRHRSLRLSPASAPAHSACGSRRPAPQIASHPHGAQPCPHLSVRVLSHVLTPGDQQAQPGFSMRNVALGAGQGGSRKVHKRTRRPPRPPSGQQAGEGVFPQQEAVTLMIRKRAGFPGSTSGGSEDLGLA